MISFEQFVSEDNIPIYLQIIGYVKRGIVAGTIRDGDEIPSRRMLSALRGVNPNTVQKSYAMLEEEGLIHSRSGAMSCVVVTGGTVRRLRQELLAGSLSALIVAMKQRGMSLDEARDALSELWEVES